ncbi:hypothetical protein Tco_1011982 [Tanacetum coccineum]
MLDGGSDVPNEGICVKIGIGSNGELSGVEKIKSLGANSVMSGSRLRVIWMEVGGGVVRARVVSSVVVKVVLIGFWVEELALEAIEQDDQEMEILRSLFAEF